MASVLVTFIATRYNRSAACRKRRASKRAAAKAVTIRCPENASIEMCCRCAVSACTWRVLRRTRWPSRTRGYTTSGAQMMQTSARRALRWNSRPASTTTVIDARNASPSDSVMMNWICPMSFIRRDVRVPTLRRAKKLADWPTTWPNSSLRRSRTTDSPMSAIR